MHANRLAECRIARGMTPTELAFRIGKSVATVSRYETGKAVPSLKMARRIATLFDCTVDELFPAAPDPLEEAA